MLVCDGAKTLILRNQGDAELINHGLVKLVALFPSRRRYTLLQYRTNFFTRVVMRLRLRVQLFP